jgi:hypothetical protein
MKNILLLILLLPAVTLAGTEEYTVNGETRLYDTDCYANTPNKKILAPGGGYYYEEAVTREECRVHGAFAKVDIYKYDFVTGSTILFKGTTWLPAERAIARKAKMDAEYKNVLNVGCATQRVEVVNQAF